LEDVALRRKQQERKYRAIGRKVRPIGDVTITALRKEWLYTDRLLMTSSLKKGAMWHICSKHELCGRETSVAR
jgi:hypothetical protein